MFTLTQTSASSLTLLSKLVHTALSAPDWAPGIFSLPTNRATNQPPAYETQIVRPKPIEMNTCIKTGEGWEAFRDLVFAAPAFLILMESYSCTKTMNNSHEIILFQKNRGVGLPLKLYLNVLSSGGRRECRHGCSREKRTCSQSPAPILTTRA